MIRGVVAMSEARNTVSDVPVDRSDAVRERQPEADAHVRDLDWLRSVGKGDRAALERLYLSYHGRLTHFLGRYTGRVDLIDEIINETLWVVWRGASAFRGDSKVSTWIFGIAYRCLMKALRDQPRRLLPSSRIRTTLLLKVRWPTSARAPNASCAIGSATAWTCFRPSNE